MNDEILKLEDAIQQKINVEKQINQRADELTNNVINKIKEHFSDCIDQNVIITYDADIDKAYFNLNNKNENKLLNSIFEINFRRKIDRLENIEISYYLTNADNYFELNRLSMLGKVSEKLKNNYDKIFSDFELIFEQYNRDVTDVLNSYYECQKQIGDLSKALTESISENSIKKLKNNKTVSLKENFVIKITKKSYIHTNEITLSKETNKKYKLCVYDTDKENYVDFYIDKNDFFNTLKQYHYHNISKIVRKKEIYNDYKINEEDLFLFY